MKREIYMIGELVKELEIALKLSEEERAEKYGTHAIPIMFKIVNSTIKDLKEIIDLIEE